LPLINTVLLLSSGATVTLAHAFILKYERAREMLRCLLATAALGLGFLLCQLFEYKYGVQFSWRDNAYGTLFFITTGFHGLHVTIGTLFLFSC
jgi:cytochrome c oxidase subunit 3